MREHGPAMVGIALMIALSGCSLESSVSGSIVVDVRGSPRFTVEPTRCVSGERAGFFGVDLVEGEIGSDRIVRVLEDPIEGTLLRVNVPGEDHSLVIGSLGCEPWEIELTRQNTRVNGIWGMAGFAEVACEDADGRVDASLEFSGCH